MEQQLTQNGGLLRKFRSVATPVYTGTNVYQNIGANYCHPSSAIAEHTDNVHDLIQDQNVYQNPYPTTYCKIDFGTIVANDNNFSHHWTFLNDGNGINAMDMKRYMFAYSNSKKELCTQIGFFGSGLKASCVALGDFFIVFSVKKQRGSDNRTVRSIGFHSELIPSEFKTLEHNVCISQDSDSQFQTVLELICEYSHFDSPESVLQMYDQIDSETGGTLIFVGIHKTTWETRYESMWGFKVDDKSKDIVTEKCFYKGTLYTDSSQPEIAKSLKHFLQVLYISNDRYSWEIRLFDQTITPLKLSELKNVKFGRKLSLESSQANRPKGGKYYMTYESPEQFFADGYTYTKRAEHHKKQMSDLKIRNKFNVLQKKPVSDIFILRRKNHNGIFAKGFYTFFYENDRLVDIQPIGLQKQKNNIANHITVIVRSNCLSCDNTKQNVVTSNVFNTVEREVKALLHYNYNPSGYGPIRKFYNVDGNGRRIKKVIEPPQVVPKNVDAEEVTLQKKTSPKSRKRKRKRVVSKMDPPPDIVTTDLLESSPLLPRPKKKTARQQLQQSSDNHVNDDGNDNIAVNNDVPADDPMNVDTESDDQVRDNNNTPRNLKDYQSFWNHILLNSERVKTSIDRLINTYGDNAHLHEIDSFHHLFQQLHPEV